MIEPRLEDTLLGCLMQDSSKLTLVKSWIPDDDFFYSDLNKRIWRAILKLEQRGYEVDVNTVCNSIEKTKYDNNLTYTILNYMDLVVSTSKIEDYCKLLHAEYLRRKLKNQVYGIQKNIDDGSLETQVLLEDAHTTIGNIIRLQPNSSFSIEDLLNDTAKSILENKRSYEASKNCLPIKEVLELIPND